MVIVVNVHSSWGAVFRDEWCTRARFNADHHVIIYCTYRLIARCNITSVIRCIVDILLLHMKLEFIYKRCNINRGFIRLFNKNNRAVFFPSCMNATRLRGSILRTKYSFGADCSTVPEWKIESTEGEWESWRMSCNCWKCWYIERLEGGGGGGEWAHFQGIAVNKMRSLSQMAGLHTKGKFWSDPFLVVVVDMYGTQRRKGSICYCVEIQQHQHEWAAIDFSIKVKSCLLLRSPILRNPLMEKRFTG